MPKNVKTSASRKWWHLVNIVSRPSPLKMKTLLRNFAWTVKCSRRISSQDINFWFHRDFFLKREFPVFMWIKNKKMEDSVFEASLTWHPLVSMLAFRFKIVHLGSSVAFYIFQREMAWNCINHSIAFSRNILGTFNCSKLKHTLILDKLLQLLYKRTIA